MVPDGVGEGGLALRQANKTRQKKKQRLRRKRRSVEGTNNRAHHCQDAPPPSSRLLSSSNPLSRHHTRSDESGYPAEEMPVTLVLKSVSVLLWERAVIPY